MEDQEKTKEQLIAELVELRSKAAAFERSEAKWLTIEKTLQKSAKSFRLLYENAPLAYQSLDENGCFLEINPAWSDLLEAVAKPRE